MKILKDSILDFLDEIEEQAYSQYRDGDRMHDYDECFVDELYNPIHDKGTASRWLGAAMDLPHYDAPHVHSDAVTVYQRWLDQNDTDEIAEARFNSNEYYRPRDTLTGYELPEYDMITQDIDWGKYPLLSDAINAQSACVSIFDNNLVVCLSGSIDYVPTEKHKRVARLICALYETQPR